MLEELINRKDFNVTEFLLDTVTKVSASNDYA